MSYSTTGALAAARRGVAAKLPNELPLVSRLSLPIGVRRREGVPTLAAGLLLLRNPLALLPRTVLQVQLHLRWRSKPEGPGDLGEVEAVDVETVLVGVRCIGVQVRPVGVAGASVEVVVLVYDALQLCLDVRQLRPWEGVLRDRHASFPEVLEEP